MLQPRLHFHVLLLACLLQFATADTGNRILTVYNRCPWNVYPALLSNSDTPGKLFSPSGFTLAAGEHKNVTVAYNWAGRLWGRTNCTTVGNDTKNLACGTGDCGGELECTGTGTPPVTLAEFTMSGDQDQTFYDVSLVDGYNLDMKIAPFNTTINGGANNTSPVCVMSTPGDEWNITHWCPWDNLLWQPPSQNNKAFWYPTQNIIRPDMSPCRSACVQTGSAKDCCTGKYDDPKKCPRSLYSKRAKEVCPDAYSYGN